MRTVVLWEGRNGYRIQDIKIWATSFCYEFFLLLGKQKERSGGGNGDVGGMVRGEEWRGGMVRRDGEVRGMVSGEELRGGW